MKMEKIDKRQVNNHRINKQNNIRSVLVQGSEPEDALDEIQIVHKILMK